MNTETRKTIKEEVKKQLDKLLQKGDRLIIEKAANGYKITVMDWEVEEPCVREILFEIETGEWGAREHLKKEKENLSEMFRQILEWMGYIWDKRSKDNPILTWDHPGDDYED